MAILHLRMHGPEHGMSAMKRFEYLEADLPHFSRGKVEFAESGNLPSFAESNARDFWCAADEQERINARVFIEIEMALPYELSLSENEALAKQAASDFFGTMFPYTMAIHWLLSAEKKRQYHLHMMLLAGCDGCHEGRAQGTVFQTERCKERGGLEQPEPSL